MFEFSLRCSCEWSGDNAMEPRDYLRVARLHWIGILAILLASLTVAGVWSLTQPRIYTAQASGYVAPRGATDLGTSMVGDQLAQAKVKSYLDIGSWRSVAESAISELGLQVTPEALVNQVKVTNPSDTVILQVSASARTPEGARDLAEAWLRGIIKQVQSIEGKDGADAPVTVVPGDSARLPTEPTSPNVRMNLTFGALLGLLLGVVYALVRHRLDQRIRSTRDVEQATGLSVVGELPLDPNFAKMSRPIVDRGVPGEEGPAVLAEAFRGLRTNLQYMSVDNPPCALVVTSAIPGDGKTFTATNLAVAVAATGRNVILIDGDLRRPSVAEIFGVPGDAGLSDVLAGRVEVADVLQPVNGSGSLKVLAAGSIPPNPSEILGSSRMRELVGALSDGAFVVIDAPPLLPVTDAAVLTTRADGALIVVSAGKTTYEMLERALNHLEKANGKALGVVLNRIPTSGADSYYGYRYSGHYYRDNGRVVAADEVPTEASKRSRRVARD